MPDAHEHEQQGVNEPADLGPMPGETQDQEEAPPGDDQVEAGDGEEPEEPKEPQEPYQIILQGFRTVSQTLVGGLLGLLAPRYTLLSGKAWQKPLLKTGLLCGEPPGPYVTG